MHAPADRHPPVRLAPRGHRAGRERVLPGAGLNESTAAPDVGKAREGTAGRRAAAPDVDEAWVGTASGRARQVPGSGGARGGRGGRPDQAPHGRGGLVGDAARAL